MDVEWRRRTWLTAVVAASVSVLAGCGGGASGGTSTAPAGAIDLAATLRVTTPITSQNLDPHLQPNYAGKMFLTPIFDRLVMADVNDKLVPGLATEWAFANDGSYLDMTLREGVHFHDGSTFDAAVVAANITRGQTLPGSSVASALSSIATVEVLDPAHVRLHLAPGTGVELPGVFTTNVGMMISGRTITAGMDIRNDPGDAGSGPYKVTSYVPQGALLLSRVERDYWDPEAGRVANIEIKPVSDATTRLNGIRTGVTDLTWVSSASEIVDAKQLAAQGVLNVDEVKYRNVLGVMMRPRGDMAKPELRQAIARAIDPEAISALFSGSCTPYRQFYPANSWPADASYEYPYTFDEAVAEDVVKHAGNVSLKLTYGSGTNTEKPANVIQAELSKVGVQTDLNPVPLAGIESRYYTGEFDAFVTNSMSAKPDPAETVAQFITGPYSLGNGSPEIEALAQKASNPTMTEDERGKIYHEIWAKTLTEALFVPICNQSNLTVYTGKVVGAENIPWVDAGVFDLRKVAMTG